jgi:hypothetical protein
MSYAQMEGIETAPETAPERSEPAVSTDDLIGRRLWLAFAVSLLAILAAGMAASFVA